MQYVVSQVWRLFSKTKYNWSLSKNNGRNSKTQTRSRQTVFCTHNSSQLTFAYSYSRCQSPKYENRFKHLWHLALGRAMNTNDENL